MGTFQDLKPTIYTGKANGKLLLTGEYLVLRSAIALAFPARKGQELEVHASDHKGTLKWTSREMGQTWFNASFQIPRISLVNASDDALGRRLEDLLKTIREKNPVFLRGLTHGVRVSTDLDFPRNWGLGTSSTLLYLLAEWSGISPYELLEATFGGSGYDIACADRTHPIFYQKTGSQANIQEIDMHLPFMDRLFLGFSGVKQDSGQEVKKFLSRGEVSDDIVKRISEISREIPGARDLMDFNALIEEHEKIMSEVLGLPAAKSNFADYPLGVKSLGAWGGDFLLFTWEDDPDDLEEYLKRKGIAPVFPFREILHT